MSAATAWPAAVVNDGQLIDNVPAPGCPFARYTVPCTVVVLTACAIIVAAASIIITAHAAIGCPILFAFFAKKVGANDVICLTSNHPFFMSFIPIASFFSLQFANSFRWGGRSGSVCPSFTPSHQLNFKFPHALSDTSRAKGQELRANS